LGAGLVRQTVTRIAGAHDLQGVSTKFDEVDFALLVDDERDAIGDAGLGHVDAVFLGHLAIEKITEQRKLKAEAFGEGFLRGRIVSTDRKDLGPSGLKLLHTGPVCFHFRRSTTGEGSGEERQHHGALADVVRQMNFAALRGWQREIRGSVADLQRCGPGRRTQEHRGEGRGAES